MKKVPLILIGILTFTAIVTFIYAKENNPNRTEFSQFLTGTFMPSTTSEHGLWATMKKEIITGSAEGDLPHGSRATFVIVSNRRFKIDEGKSFINGTWKFVSSNGDEISGIFIGQGTTPNEFFGKFMTNESQKNLDAYAHAKIQGEFKCWMASLPSYVNLWEFRAWWNGTYQEGGG